MIWAFGLFLILKAYFGSISTNQLTKLQNLFHIFFFEILAFIRSFSPFENWTFFTLWPNFAFFIFGDLSTLPFSSSSSGARFTKTS
jgi:hypothetical protein